VFLSAMTIAKIRLVIAIFFFGLFDSLGEIDATYVNRIIIPPV